MRMQEMQGDVPSSPVATVAADIVANVDVWTILTDVVDGYVIPGMDEIQRRDPRGDKAAVVKMLELGRDGEKR